MWNDIATRWVDNVSNLLSILIKTISPWHLMVYWKRWKDKSDENASGGPSVVSVKGWTSSRFFFFFFFQTFFFSPLFFFSPNQFIPAIVRQQSANHETFNRDSKGTIVPLPPSSRRKKKKRKAIELCCFFISTSFSSILFPRNKLKLSFLLRISF